MRTPFYNRFDCDEHIGDDTIQVLKTKGGLKYVRLSVDAFKGCPEDLKYCYLVNILNLMLSNSAMAAIKLANKFKKRIVFSSIFWDLVSSNCIGRNKNIVHKILQKFPIYCHSCAVSDIYIKIFEARDIEINNRGLSEFIVDNFSWAGCLNQTENSYKFILNK